MRQVICLVIASLFALGWLAQAEEPGDVTRENTSPSVVLASLEAQAQALAVAVQAREVHPIHQIDHAMTDETAALQKSLPSLASNQKLKLAEACADLCRQASRAHHDGHKSNWADAADAQQQFAADLQQIKLLLAASGFSFVD